MVRSLKHLDCDNIRYVFRKGFDVEINYCEIEQAWFVFPIDNHLTGQHGLGETISEALSDYAEVFDLLYLECQSGKHSDTIAGKRLARHVKHLVHRIEKIPRRLS